MKLKLVCKKHQTDLVNCGTGMFLYPTSTQFRGDEGPSKDADGFMEVDFSEYACPQDEYDGDDDNVESCNEDWDILVQR